MEQIWSFSRARDCIARSHRPIGMNENYFSTSRERVRTKKTTLNLMTHPVFMCTNRFTSFFDSKYSWASFFSLTVSLSLPFTGSDGRKYVGKTDDPQSVDFQHKTEALNNETSNGSRDNRGAYEIIDKLNASCFVEWKIRNYTRIEEKWMVQRFVCKKMCF